MMPAVAALLPAALEAAGKVLDRLFPDPQAAAQAKIKLLEMQQAGEFKQLDVDLQLALQQMQVNMVEASSDDLFKGGWRPFIGWVCGAGLAYQFFFRPLFNFALALAMSPVSLPALELDTLMTMLFAMLGLGAYRSYEKVKGAL